MPGIRAAVATDAAAVAAVGREAFTRQYEGLVDPANYTWAAEQWYSDEAIEAAITRCAHDPAAYFLVADHDGRVVGFLRTTTRQGRTRSCTESTSRRRRKGRAWAAC